MTVRLRQSAFVVTDVARALLFYEAAFGLRVSYRHASGAYAEIECGRFLLCFVAREFPGTTAMLGRLCGARDGAAIVLLSEDPATSRSRALAAGARPAPGPESLIADPLGTVIEIARPSLQTVRQASHSGLSRWNSPNMVNADPLYVVGR